MAYFFQFWRSSPHSVWGCGQAPAAPPAASDAALPAASAAAQICTLQSQNAKQREARQSLRREKDDQDRLQTSKSTRRPVAGAQVGRRAACTARRPIPFDDSRRRRPPRAAPVTRAHGVRDRVNDDMENKRPPIDDMENMRPPIEGVARARIKGFTTAAPAGRAGKKSKSVHSWVRMPQNRRTSVSRRGLVALGYVCVARQHTPQHGRHDGPHLPDACFRPSGLPGTGSVPVLLLQPPWTVCVEIQTAAGQQTSRKV